MVEVYCLHRRPHHSAKNGMPRRIGSPSARALRGRLCTRSGRAGCLLRRRSSTRPSQTADVGPASALHVPGDCERAGNRAAPSGMGACASRSSAPRSPWCAATPVHAVLYQRAHGTFRLKHQGWSSINVGGVMCTGRAYFVFKAHHAPDALYVDRIRWFS